MLFNSYEFIFGFLPVTALVGFLIGVTISYLSALQLRNFGADLFIVNILGVSIIRELGPVLVPERGYKPRTEAGDKAAAAIAPTGDESPAAIAHRHLPILEQNLQRLRDSGLGESSPQVSYHKAQLKKFRAALAA